MRDAPRTGAQACILRYARGANVAQWSYVSLGADEWREVQIPAALLPASGDELEVTFEIEAPARPAIPGSMDARTLGIGLVEYQLASR